jgi:AcrR family transcriptional regulator
MSSPFASLLPRRSSCASIHDMSSAQEHRQGKRSEILKAATERFGRDGYEDTKWADIAADVGVGPTALYHYFESKQHCLFEIMDEAITGFHSRFEQLAAAHPVHLEALIAIVEDCFELTEHEIQRNRVLVAEQGLLAGQRRSPREERSRRAVRERVRDLEFAWATFLARAMEQGAIPEGDPRLLTRAILGLYNSIWHWYRPNGVVALHRAADFYTTRILAMVGASRILSALSARFAASSPFPTRSRARGARRSRSASGCSRARGRCGPGRFSALRRSRRPTRSMTQSASSPTAWATSSSPGRCASRRCSPSPIPLG